MNKKAETLLETIIKVGKKINLVLMAFLICACSFFGLGQINISHGGLNNLGTKHVTMKIVQPNYTYSGRGYMTARYRPVIFMILDDAETIETGTCSDSTSTNTNIILSEQEKTITSTGSKGYVKDYTKFKDGEYQYAGWAGTDRSLYSKVVTSDEYTSETFMTLLKKYKTKIGNLPLAHYNHMFMGGSGLLENTTILSGYGYSKRFYDDLSKALAYYDVGYKYTSGKYTFTLPGKAKTDDMYGLFAPYTGVYNANNYLKEKSITIGSNKYTIYGATGDSDLKNKAASGDWGKNRNRTNAANYITTDYYGALMFSIESERPLTIGRGPNGKRVSGADNSYGANLKKILTALYDTKDADGKELATSDGDKAALVAAIADSTRQSAYKLMKGAYENGQIDATLNQYFNKVNPSKSYNLSTIKTKDLLLANNYGIRHSTFNIRNTLVYIPNDTLDYLQTNSGKTGISLPSSGTAKAFNQLNSETASASKGLRVLFYTFDEENSRGGIEMSTANLEQNSSGKLVAGKESSGIFFNGMYKYHSSSKVTANSGGMTSVMNSIRNTNSNMGYTFSVIWDEIWSKPATNFMGTDTDTDKLINELLTSDEKFDLGGKKYTGSGSKITLAEMIEFYAYGGMEKVNTDYAKVTGYSIDPHFKKLKETIKTKLDSLAKDEKALAVASNVIGTMLDIRTEIKGDTYDYKWAGGAYDGDNYIGDFWDYYCAYMVKQYANGVNKVIPIAEAVGGGLKDYSNEVLNISDIDLYCYMYMIAKATEGTNLNNGLSARYFDAITEMLACAMYGKVPMGANIQFITGNVNTSPSDGPVKWSSDAGLVPWASYLVSYEDIKNYVYQSRSDTSVALPKGAYYVLKQQAINNIYAYDMINKGIYGGLSNADLDSNTYTSTYGNNGRTSIMTFAAVNSNALKYYAVGGAYVSSATSQYESNSNPWNRSMFNTDSNYLLSAINTMGKYPSTLYSNYPLEMPAGSIVDGTWTQYIVKYHIGISKSRFNNGVTWKHAYKAGNGSKGDIYVDKSKLTKISDSISSISMAKGTGMTIIAGSGVSSKQVASSTLAINYDNIASNKGAIPEYIAIALNRYYHADRSAGEKMFRVIAGYGSSQYLDSGYGCGTYIAGAIQGHAIPDDGEHIIFGVDAELLWTGSKSAPKTTTERTKLAEYDHETIVNGNASTVEEKAIMNLTYKIYEIGAKTIEREKTLKAEDTARLSVAEGGNGKFRENAEELYKRVKDAYKDNIYIRVTSSKADGTNVDQQFTENDKIVEKSNPTLKKVLKNVKSEKEDKSAYNEPIKLTEGELKALFGLNETKVYTGYYLDFSQVAVNAGKSDTKSITPAWYAEYGIKVDLCTKNKNGDFVNIFSNAEFNSGKLVKVDENKLNAAFDIALLHAKKSDGSYLFNDKDDISDTIGSKIKAGAKQYTYAYAGLKSASELVNVAGDATKSTFDGETAMSLKSNYYLTDAGKTEKRTEPAHYMYLSVTVGSGIDAKGALLYEDNKQHSRKFEFKDGEAGSKAVGTPVYVDLKFDVDTNTKFGSKTLGDVLNDYLDKYSSFGISAEAVNNGSIVLEGSVNSENELKWSDTTKGSTVKGLKLYYSASDSSHSKTQEAKLNTPIEINQEKFKELMGLDTEVGTSTNYGHYLNFFYDWNNIKVSLEGSSSELPGNYKFYNTIKVKLWGKGASGFEPLNEILWEYDDGNYIMTGFNTPEGEKTQMYVQGISIPIPILRELQPYPMLNTWYNIPQTFAEIKQGTINPNGDGSIEKYDAMSGVPSTEKLYFTSGGSEFVVEIATALMQGEKTTRTYTSKFNQITDGCEFMLGDQLHGGVGKQEVTTEWGRNGNSYILGNSSNRANTKVTEWYNLATPEGASSYNVTVNAHRADTVIKAEWSGTITNADSGAKPSDGTSAVGYNPGPGNNALSDMCAVESNSNALAGQYGEPGSMGTERNSNYNWNVDSYNTALTNAYNWAKAMEDASATAKGNIAKLSNSDGVTRSYHSGKATITIKIDGISVSSMADEQKNKQANGTWAGTTQVATTSNYTTFLLKSNNDARLGTTWREDYGAKAVRGASSGCVKSCWELAKYNARPEQTIKYISSYTVTRGVNSAYATPNYTEFKYRASWCGATSYTKTDATWSFTPCYIPEHTHSSSCYDPETGAQTCGKSEHKHTTYCGSISNTSGSHTVHTCTHSCGSWSNLVETKAIKMGNPTFKIVVTFENNYVTSDGPNNVDQKTPTNTLPAHVLCGPCCEHTTLPTIYDKWQQQSEYDYTQIVKLNVFKISRSYLEGGELADILYTEDESIMAKVIQGEPNIYYNIAAMNDNYRNSEFESRKEVSLSGRVRYSVQPQQHDNVLWDEKMVTDKAGGKTVTGHGQNKRSYDCDGQSGTIAPLNPNKVSVNGHENEWSDGILYNRTNNSTGEQYSDKLEEAYKNYTTDEKWFENILQDNVKKGYTKDTLDEKDIQTYEYNRFDFRRKTENTMYVVSDMLILQTSTGDQSVLYFEKKNTAETQQHFVNNEDVERAIRWNGDDSEVVARQAVNEMWNNNTKSAGNKSATNWIATGGYIGLGGVSPYSKFSGGNNKQNILTIFDDGSAADANKTQTDDKANVTGPQTVSRVTSITNSLDANLFKASPNKADGYELRMNRNTRFRNLVHELQINPIAGNKGYNTGNAYQGYLELIDYVFDYSKLPDYWKQEVGDGGSTIKELLEEPNRYNEEENEILNGKFYVPRADFTLGTTEAIYTAGQNKVNNIIIHTPVSIANSMVISLEDARDQRTTELYDEGIIDNNSYGQVCPRVPGSCQFSYLDCHYFEDTVIYSTDFEDTANIAVTNDGVTSVQKITTRYVDDYGITHIVDSTGQLDLELPEGFEIVPASFTGGVGNALSCKGLRWQIPLSALGIESYNGNDRIRIDMDIKLNDFTGPTMVVSFYGYDFYIPTASGVFTWNTGNDVELQADKSLAGNGYKLSMIFDFYNIEKSEAYINGNKVNYTRVNNSFKITKDLIGDYLNIGSWGKDDNYPANFIIDNLVITKLAGLNHHTEACYKEVYECEVGTYYTCQVPVRFNYTGKVQSFTAPQSGYYLLEAYGASGGNSNLAASSIGGRGGYTSGKVFLTKGETIYVYVGGQGTLSTDLGNGGGWNGGGHGGPNGYGGGGMTHFSYSGTDDVSKSPILDGLSGNIGRTTYYEYTGNYQAVTLEPGTYKLEAWGAAGGPNGNYGYGGYTSGTVTFDKTTTIYLYVGGQGLNQSDSIANHEVSSKHTFNGGGPSYYSDGLVLEGHEGGQGGGATDFRLTSGAWDNLESLKSRILVAGGGGGSGCASLLNPAGHGGGLVGGTSFNTNPTYNGYQATGGSQTAGGVGMRNNEPVGGTLTSSGSFGKGAGGSQCGAGGGGGYYGGGSGYTAGGGGGSSFVTGYTGCDATYRSLHKGLTFSDVVIAQGVNNGQGKAAITKVANIGNYTEYRYTGDVQSITLQPGTYLLEAWGAQGGMYTSGYEGAYGGYTKGIVTFDVATTLYIYVGNMGGSYPNNLTAPFNGGGRGYAGGGDGGGATDFRLTGGAWNDTTSLRSRILVAGGGGGSDLNSRGGAGGGLTGESNAFPQTGSIVTGGGQKSGGTGSTSNGSFGLGGGNGTSIDGGGGGGGYYGGAAGYNGHCAGSGGSSFVTGFDGCDTTYRAQQGNLNFSDVDMQTGVSQGNGKARITKLASSNSAGSNKWTTWTNGNMNGFVSMGATLTASNGDLVITPSGSWEMSVPVSIPDASVIREVRITLDNNTDYTCAGISKNNDVTGDYYVYATAQTRTKNQTLVFKPKWTGSVNKIIFDLMSMPAGTGQTVVVKNIEIIDSPFDTSNLILVAGGGGGSDNAGVPHTHSDSCYGNVTHTATSTDNVSGYTNIVVGLNNVNLTSAVNVYDKPVPVTFRVHTGYNTGYSEISNLKFAVTINGSSEYYTISQMEQLGIITSYQAINEYSGYPLNNIDNIKTGGKASGSYYAARFEFSLMRGSLTAVQFNSTKATSRCPAEDNKYHDGIELYAYEYSCGQMVDDGSGGHGGGLVAGNAKIAGVEVKATDIANLPNISGLVTKEFDGATWARILYQDISNNTNYFTTSNYLDVNKPGLFSALGRLSEFKSSTKYEFLLEYPDATGTYAGQYNRWKQTNNPLDEKTNDGSTMTTPVTGYEAVHVDWNPYGSGGLEFNGSVSVLDGSVGFGNWWLCVGIMNTSYTPTNTTEKPYTMPGIPYIGNDKVALWVRVDGLLGGISPKPTQDTNGGGTGLGGTQTSGYAMGRGESATYGTDTGGAGGGYYGGYVTNHNNGGAGGGSGYISKFVTDGKSVAGANQGDGYAVITLVDHIHTAACQKEASVNNTHTHTVDCITDSEFLQSLLLGAYTTGNTSEAVKYLGSAATNAVLSNEVIATINDWEFVTDGNRSGTVSKSGTTLILTATNTDPHVELATDIDAGAVSRIEISYTASGIVGDTNGSIYFSNGSGYTEERRLNSQEKLENTSTVRTLSFITGDSQNWRDKIKGFRLDLPNNGASAGNKVTIHSIRLIGAGNFTKTIDNSKQSSSLAGTTTNYTSTGRQTLSLGAGKYTITLYGAAGADANFSIPGYYASCTGELNSGGYYATCTGVLNSGGNYATCTGELNSGGNYATCTGELNSGGYYATCTGVLNSGGYYASCTGELNSGGNYATCTGELNAGGYYACGNSPLNSGYYYTCNQQCAYSYKPGYYTCGQSCAYSPPYTYTTAWCEYCSWFIYIQDGVVVYENIQSSCYNSSGHSITVYSGTGDGYYYCGNPSAHYVADEYTYYCGNPAAHYKATTHTHTSSCPYKYTTHEHTSACGYVAPYHTHTSACGYVAPTSGTNKGGNGESITYTLTVSAGDVVELLTTAKGSGGKDTILYLNNAPVATARGGGDATSSANGANVGNGVNNGNGKATVAIITTAQRAMKVTKTTPKGMIDGTTASVSKALTTIKTYYSTIPVYVDGNLNPLFTCDGIPDKHVHTAKCNTPILILDCNEPHHEGEHYDKSNPICWSACMNDENHKAAKDRVVVVDNDGTAKVITRGNFINNDYKFSIYYPNMGDFYETGAYGHTTLQQSRGLGYVNGTDTTQWIREKKIKFEFDVLFENPATGQWEYYSAGQWIDLPITTTGDTNRDWHVSQANIAIHTYNFYNLLSNDEMASSKVEFAIEAINCDQGGISKDAVYEKNDFLEYTNVFESTNRNRESGYQTQNGNAIGFVSNHGAYVNNYIDLVGRIGNMFITDTEDLRFSNFFKKVDNDNWIIEPIIHEVYEDQQARFIAIAKSDSINGVNNATYDVRGVLTSEATKYFNTWGTQDWMDGVIEYYSLPLSASLNNIEQLRTDEMKVGYNVLWEITTIGNYDKLQVAPFFYAYDTQTGTISPVDVWYKINNSFRAINIYNLLNEPAYLDIMKNNLQDTITDPKWTAFKEQGLDNYILSLDWVAEKARRGFGGTEEDITRNTALMYGTPIWLGDTDGDGIEESTVAPLTTPYGNSYTLGTLQLLTPASRARTFIGSSYTISENFNGDSNTDINHMIADEKYGYHAQRWHLKLGLPSSAEFVLYNSAVGHIHPLDVAPGTETRNMDLLKEKNADGTSRYVIMMAVDIKAIGSTWNLRYDAYGNVGQRIKVRGNNVILPADMPNVIAVYDTLDTSLIDIQIIGTH